MESIKAAADKVPDREPKRCSSCKNWKARDDFSLQPGARDGTGRHNECKQCRRIKYHLYYHEGRGKAAKAEYQARQHVKERRSGYDRDHADARAESRRAYNRTPRGKLFAGLYQAKKRLKSASTDERRARLAALVAMYDREIARLDRENELRREPPSTHRPYGARAKFRGVYLKADGRYVVRVSVGAGQSVNGGCHATAEAARAACNALAERLLGVEGYAIERGKR